MSFFNLGTKAFHLNAWDDSGRLSTLPLTNVLWRGQKQTEDPLDWENPVGYICLFFFLFNLYGEDS